jgi:O-antigen ligase
MRRVGGGLGQINVAGAYFATAALFTLGLLATGYRRWLEKLALLGCVVASTVGLVLPASRGAFVGFLAGALPQAIRAGVVGFLILALIVGGFLAWAPGYVKERVTKTQEAITTDDADRYDALNQDSGGRFDFWKASLKIIAAHPILGVGFGRTHLAMEDLVGTARSPHNAYLSTAGDMGIPGLLGLLWLFWIALRAAGSLTRSPGFPRGLGLAFRGAILGLMVSNLFGGRIFCFNIGGAFAFLTALVFRARSLLQEKETELA